MNVVLKIMAPVLILAAGVVGLQIFGQKPEVPTEDATSGDGAVPVVTADVTDWTGPFNISVDGEAVTYRVVTVGAEVEGRIVRKAEIARGGTHVQQGDVLFEIDSTNYQLEIDRLKAELLQADEELNTIRVDRENTAELVTLAEEDWQLQQKQLARMKELLSRKTANDTEVETAMKQELTSRNSLQNLRNQQRTLAQQLKTKEANKALVLAQLERANVDLRRCRVVSPLEGRIVADVVEEGDYIQPGEQLVQISDGSRMEIKTKLRGEELAWIWQQNLAPEQPNDPHGRQDPLNLPEVACEVGFEFEGVETIWDGYIARIEGTGIDRDTRTFPCRVLVEQPEVSRVSDSAGTRATLSPPTLLSGMFVTVRIPVESPLPLLQIPLEAVRPGGRMWVYRNGQLNIVSVSLAHVDGEIALIRRAGSDLEAGDQVITSPLASVREGMSVSPVDTSAETGQPAAEPGGNEPGDTDKSLPAEAAE